MTDWSAGKLIEIYETTRKILYTYEYRSQTSNTSNLDRLEKTRMTMFHIRSWKQIEAQDSLTVS